MAKKKPRKPRIKENGIRLIIVMGAHSQKKLKGCIAQKTLNCNIDLAEKRCLLSSICVVENQRMSVQAHILIGVHNYTAELYVLLYSDTLHGSQDIKISCLLFDLFLIREVDA